MARADFGALFDFDADLCDKAAECGHRSFIIMAGALDGVPVTLKDNIAAKDAPCTCASKILEGFVSPYDAFVTRRLRAAGCVLLKA